MPRILIVAPAWVGDAVLTLPLIRRLRERYHDVEIDVLAPAWTHPLFERVPEVRSTLESPFRHGELAFGQRRATARAIKARRYDQAIVLPNSFKSALVPWLAGIPRRTGYVGELRYGLINDARRLDEAALPLMAERFAALAEDQRSPRLRPLANPELRVDPSRRDATLARFKLTLDRPVAVLCPGAEYGPAKRWPANYFAALANRLQIEGYAVWITGSAKDAPIGQDIVGASPGAIDLCGKSSLAEAIDLISCAALVVSNDSGLMHIAAALGRPLTALYGSSSPQFTPPLSEYARVVKLDVPCSPCFQRVCPLKHFDCMMKLTPEIVWSRMERPAPPVTKD
jgi:heptosyltransferase-2